MQNLISVVRSMLDSGATVTEIVNTLKEMGVSEEDAKKLILLANREILLTLRNELKDVVRSVLEEERETFVSDVKEDLRSYLDAQLRMINRNLFKLTRDEMNKYISELSRVEEKVDVLERKVLRLEEEQSSSPIKTRKLLHPKIILSAIGVALLIVGAVVELEQLWKIAVMVIGAIMVLGGLLIG